MRPPRPRASRSQKDTRSGRLLLTVATSIAGSFGKERLFPMVIQSQVRKTKNSLIRALSYGSLQSDFQSEIKARLLYILIIYLLTTPCNRSCV